VSIAESLARANPVWDIPRSRPTETSVSRPPEHALAARLAMTVHRDGSQARFEVERSFEHLPPGVTIDSVVQYGQAQSWIVDRGGRVARGDLEPQLAPVFQ
jgi:hypothetical protein